MSIETPVFTAAVDCSVAAERPIPYDRALSLIPENHWLSTSRNWWYQGLVAQLLQAYAGFSDADYLTKVVAVVETKQLAHAAKAIAGLIRAIEEDTDPFIEATSWYGASGNEVRAAISEAAISRDVDDDCRFAFANFFSFLASQVAALEEAQSNRQCLLYVQTQP